MVVPSDFLMDFLIENPLGNLVPRQKTGPRVGSTKLPKTPPPGIRTRVARLEGEPATTAPQVLSHPPVLLSPIRKSRPRSSAQDQIRIKIGIKIGIKSGSKIFCPIRPGPDPARLPPCHPPHMPPHSHTLTHSHAHTRTPAHTIDFNTPRLTSFGKKRENQMYLQYSHSFAPLHT